MMKILNILGKTLVVFLLLVLFIIYVVIPVGVPLAVRYQGSKMLKAPVQLRSVWFNPLLLRVSVNGFKILDDQTRQEMAGFKKFWVDLSFLSLFKKEYRVESCGLQGLVVNAVLLPDGTINLMKLAPAATEPAVQPAEPAKATAEEQSPAGQIAARQPAAPLSKLRVDKFILADGFVSFRDLSVSPQFSTQVKEMNLTVNDISNISDNPAKAVFNTRLDEKGTISIEALFKPFKQPLELETSFSLNNYALGVLTPYVGKFTGRSVKDGKLDLKMDYKIAGNKINARHKLLIQKFDFGQKVESKDALPLPFGLAIAILEDPEGKIDFAVPVTGDMSDPKFNYWALLGKVARNFIIKLVASPFTSLASVMGAESGTEETGFVSFEPGKAALADAQKEKLQAAVKLLEQRPKLVLEVNGSYDPADDWKQIKADAFESRYEAMRKESSRGDTRLITQLYKEKFGVRAYNQLIQKFSASGQAADETAMEAEMKRLIIEEGAPDKKALEKLAAERGKLVYDMIVASGFDTARVKNGPVRPTTSSMGAVPLEFTLTVFGEEKE